MIGLDTNILVRYFTQDDSVLSPRANRIISGLTVDEPGFVSLVALAEVFWVLDRSYRLSSIELVNVVRTLLQVETFRVQNEAQVFTAMVTLQSGTGSFSDALIGALGAWAGCAATLTFDRRAARLDQFQLG